MAETPEDKRARAPFDKIRSLLERKKLIENVIIEGGEILCKADGDLLFNVIPKFIEQEQATQKSFIKGELQPAGPITDAFKTLSNETTNKHEIVGNFSIKDQRYFLKGEMVILKPWVFLPLECDVFHFQRRQSMRIALPNDVPFLITILDFDRTTLFNLARVLDISAGGAKLYFTGAERSFGVQQASTDPGLKVGSVFKVIVKPPSEKNIECHCEVKHMKEELIDGVKRMAFGTSFVNLSSSQKNRLTAMTLDLQRKILTSSEG